MDFREGFEAYEREHPLPGKDIFVKEDRQKPTAPLAGVGAEAKHLRGGHPAFVSSPELYIKPSGYSWAVYSGKTAMTMGERMKKTG